MSRTQMQPGRGCEHPSLIWSHLASSMARRESPWEAGQQQGWPPSGQGYYPNSQHMSIASGSELPHSHLTSTTDKDPGS